MKQILFTTFLLITVLSTVGGQEGFFEKYNLVKAFSSCFGRDLYEAELSRVNVIKSHCQQKPTYIPNMPEVNVPVFATQQPGYYADIGGQTVFVPITYQYSVPTTTFAHGHNRQGRQIQRKPFYDRAALEGSLQKVFAGLSNFTCVLKELQYVDEDLNMNINVIVDQIQRTPGVHETLKKDLIDNYLYCKDLAQCVPLERLKSPVPLKLQQLILFTKCEKKLRLHACFKHDIRTNLHEFDLTVLPKGHGAANNVDKLAAILIGAESIDDDLDFL